MRTILNRKLAEYLLAREDFEGELVGRADKMAANPDQGKKNVEWLWGAPN